MAYRVKESDLRKLFAYDGRWVSNGHWALCHSLIRSGKVKLPKGLDVVVREIGKPYMTRSGESVPDQEFPPIDEALVPYSRDPDDLRAVRVTELSFDVNWIPGRVLMAPSRSVAPSLGDILCVDDKYTPILELGKPCYSSVGIANPDDPRQRNPIAIYDRREAAVGQLSFSDLVAVVMPLKRNAADLYDAIEPLLPILDLCRMDPS